MGTQVGGYPLVQASQQANTVTGDMAGGNIDKSTNYFGATNLTAMTRCIQEYAIEKAQDVQVKSFIAALEHYMCQAVEGDIRDLEEKLAAADRKDQLVAARLRKHQASQFVLRHQSSPAAQKIISFLLAKILTCYENKVLPLVNAKASRVDIDSAIQTHVIESAWDFLESNPLSIDHRMLTGFLYFLGGNCHLRWDPC